MANKRPMPTKRKIEAIPTGITGDAAMDSTLAEERQRVARSKNMYGPLAPKQGAKKEGIVAKIKRKLGIQY